LDLQRERPHLIRVVDPLTADGDLGRTLDDAGHLLAELLDVRVMKLELDRDFSWPDFLRTNSSGEACLQLGERYPAAPLVGYDSPQQGVGIPILKVFDICRQDLSQLLGCH